MSGVLLAEDSKTPPGGLFADGDAETLSDEEIDALLGEEANEDISDARIDAFIDEMLAEDDWNDLWHVEFSVLTAWGFDSNALVTRTDRIEATFIQPEAELFVSYQSPRGEDGAKFYFLASGVYRHYRNAYFADPPVDDVGRPVKREEGSLSAQELAEDTYLGFALMHLDLPVSVSTRLGARPQYYLVRQPFDLTLDPELRELVNLKIHQLATELFVQHDFSESIEATLEFFTARTEFYDLEEDYQLRRFELTLQWEATAKDEIRLQSHLGRRDYRNREPRDADGFTLSGQRQRYDETELAARWDRQWLDDDRLETELGFAVRTRRDGVEGYGDFDRYGLNFAVKSEIGKWQFEAEWIGQWTEYLVRLEEEGATGDTLDVWEVQLTGDIERALTEEIRWYFRVLCNWGFSEDEEDSYRRFQVYSGIKVTF